LGLLLLLGLAFALVLLLPRLGEFPDRRTKSAVEAILLGAELDPARAVQRTIDGQGVHHWRVALPDSRTRLAVVRGLEQWTLGQGGYLEKGQARPLKGRTHQLVSLVLGANRLQLLLVEEPGAPRRISDPAQDRQKGKSAEGQSGQPPAVAEGPADPLPGEGQPAEQNPQSSPLQESAPRVAIVIDDIGQAAPGTLSPLLDLNLPITFAVLPHLRHSTEAATFLHQRHYQVMLHMPMEPDNFPKTNPGPGAIHAHLNRQEILDCLQRGLASVPFAVGVNNHMGSKITANRTLMELILQELKGRDLFFIDSRTHTSTIAYETARSLGMRCGQRQVFLDSEEELSFTRGQLREAWLRAERGEAIIAIGHPYPSTVRALVEELPRMDRAGIQFVFASALVSGPFSSN
jgi:polysaccharide deacetylase 2 family uncharacterized protein YibQ